MEYVSKIYERFFGFFFLSPISGLGKLYLIIAKNFRTILKVFSVSFDRDLMDGIQKPSMGLKWYSQINNGAESAVCF